jgi:hypothetical protein
MTTRFSPAALVLAVASCASGPAGVHPKVYDSMGLHKTTQQQLTKKAGAPTWVEFLDFGSDRLIYQNQPPTIRHEFAPIEYVKNVLTRATYDFVDGVLVAKSWERLERDGNGLFQVREQRSAP